MRCVCVPFHTNAMAITITHTFMDVGRGGGERVRPGLGNPDDRIAGARYAWGKRLRLSQPESVMTMMDDDDEGGEGRGLMKTKKKGRGRSKSSRVCKSVLHTWVSGFVVGGLPGRVNMGKK